LWLVDKSIVLLFIYFICIFLLVYNLMNFVKDFLILVNYFKLPGIIWRFIFILISKILIITIILIYLYILWLYFMFKFFLHIVFKLLFLIIENILIETHTSLLFIIFVLMCKRYPSIYKFLMIDFVIITFCLVIFNLLLLFL
jgi:hypothetical protein